MTRAGAAPGPGPATFDVEPFRTSGRRRVVVRRVDRVTLILGSRQSDDVVDRDQLTRRGVPVWRRRSGGGAVLLVPGESIWLDAWLPAGDALADDDVRRASGWIGEWWVGALGSLGVDGLTVHQGSPAQRQWSDLVCFAGLAAGEVHLGGRKVVGVAQWRCRQGTLLQSMAYLRWDGAPLLDLLQAPAGAEALSRGDLEAAAVGIGDLAPVSGTAAVESLLLEHLPGQHWEVATAGVAEPGDPAATAFRAP